MISIFVFVSYSFSQSSQFEFDFTIRGTRSLVMPSLPLNFYSYCSNQLSAIPFPKPTDLLLLFSAYATGQLSTNAKPSLQLGGGEVLLEGGRKEEESLEGEDDRVDISRMDTSTIQVWPRIQLLLFSHSSRVNNSDVVHDNVSFLLARSISKMRRLHLIYII